MTTVTQRNLAADVARGVVTELANKELADFDETAEEYWHNPRRVRDLYRDGDDVLGFGGLDAAIITPAALYITTEVMRFLLESAKGGLGTLIGDFFKEMIGRSPKKNSDAREARSPMRQFTPEQLDQAHKVGRKAAKELGLPDNKTELVVNAVIVHFVRVTAQHAQSRQA
jgi:hypothetical protein